MEGNRLIAEFMEYELEDVSNLSNEYTKGGEVWVATMSKEDDTHLGRHLLFQTSWDWLIPVVQKIEQYCEGVPQEMLNISLYSDINEVHKAVVEFINEHNKTI